MDLRPIQRWRFLFLLCALLLMLVVEPIAFGLRVHWWVFDLFYSFTVLCAMFALTAQRRHRLIIIEAGVLTLLITWLAQAMPGSSWRYGQVASHLLGVAFIWFAVYATVRSMFAARVMTLDSVFGSIAAYLLLGNAWAMVYATIALIDPSAFSLDASLTQFLDNRHSRLPMFNYYSFVTLTTVGFGDITPVSQAARTLSWLEAVSGQFYIATLVAWIVGRTTRRSRKRKTKAAVDDRLEELSGGNLDRE